MKSLNNVAIRNICIVAVIVWTTVQAEFFTAISDLQKLIYTEQEVTVTLEKYIELEEKRLQKIKKFSQQYADLYENAKNNKEMFLSNPVNAYVLLKHLTKDWTAATSLIENTDGQELINSLILEEDFPNKEDLSGAATALIRLQHIYSLETAAIAQGHINGTHATFELTAADCFELGKEAFETHSPKYTLNWMLEALKRLDKETIPTVERVKVLEYITYSAYDAGNFTLGLTYLDELLKINPNYPRLVDNFKYYQHKFDEWNMKVDSNETIEAPEQTFEINGRVWKEKELLLRYKQLCRGETMKTPREQSKLYCYRTANDNHYFLLQPIKVEELNLDPKLVMFHDVMSDAESQEIKDTATPLLRRAVVQNILTGDIEVTTDRISKSTVLSDEQYEVSAKVNKRIEHIVGLSTEFSEPIHVINYGIGGHYEPHFDFAQVVDNDEVFSGLGNRIATWIFYLTDVLAGGSTVFPVLGVEVKPVKGAAAFWYNLYKNGAGNKNTLHAACPVLAGSKWVSNKWLHERGQEFRRPCSLNPME